MTLNVAFQGKNLTPVLDPSPYKYLQICYIYNSPLIRITLELQYYCLAEAASCVFLLCIWHIETERLNMPWEQGNIFRILLSNHCSIGNSVAEHPIMNFPQLFTGRPLEKKSLLLSSGHLVTKFTAYVVWQDKSSRRVTNLKFSNLFYTWWS